MEPTATFTLGPVRTSVAPRRAASVRGPARSDGLVAIFMLALVLPLLSYGISLSTVVIIPLLLVALRDRGRQGVRFGMAELSLVAFLAVAFASLGNTHNLTTGVVSLARYAFWATVAWAGTVLMMEPGRELAARRAGAIGVTLLGAMVLADVALYGAIEGTFRLVPYSRNGVGVIISSFFPLLLHEVLVTRGRLVVRSLAFGVALAAIVVLNSRGCWTAVLLTSSSYLLFNLQLRTLIRTTIAVGIVASLLLAAPGVFSSVSRRFDSLNHLDEEFGYQVRLAQRKRAMVMFRRSPWVGVGIGNFVGTRADWLRSEVNKPVNLEKRSAHSAYFQLLAETGILGCAALALHLLVIVAGIVTIPPRARGGVFRAPWLYALAGCLVHLTVLSGLTTTAPWFLMGAARATVKRSQVAPQGVRRL